MENQPFVINLSDKDLPNIAVDDNTGYEYSKTNLWQKGNTDILILLNTINEKIDIIINLLKQKGKE